MSEELKPCPFCGCRAEVADEDYESRDIDFVQCTDCGTRTDGYLSGTVSHDIIIGEWNTRAPQNEWISVDGAVLKYNALYHVLLKNKMIIVCRFNDYQSLGGHTNYWQDLNRNDISMDGTMFIEIATPTPPKEI